MPLRRRVSMYELRLSLLKIKGTEQTSPKEECYEEEKNAERGEMTSTYTSCVFPKHYSHLLKDNLFQRSAAPVATMHLDCLTNSCVEQNLQSWMEEVSGPLQSKLKDGLKLEAVGVDVSTRSRQFCFPFT